MKHIHILILCIAFALLTGCAPAAQDTAAYAPDESERLVLYTSHKKEVWWPIVKEFESRTGIWVEVVQGGTNELLEQLQKEQDAPRADVMFGGGVEGLAAYADCFTPYTARGASSSWWMRSKSSLLPPVSTTTQTPVRSSNSRTMGRHTSAL